MKKILEEIFEHPCPDEGILKELPHNPVNLKEIIKTARSERIFKLKDNILGGYVLETYKVSDRNYITLVSEVTIGKSCMSPLNKGAIASKHTTSMESAAQLHYDALGYLSKRF